MVISEGHVRHDGLSRVQGALSSSELLEGDVLLLRSGSQRDGGRPRAAEGHQMSGYGHHNRTQAAEEKLLVFMSGNVHAQVLT